MKINMKKWNSAYDDGHETLREYDVQYAWNLLAYYNNHHTDAIFDRRIRVQYENLKMDLIQRGVIELNAGETIHFDNEFREILRKIV